jgi:excisionase family DNA binding protein
MGKRHNARRFPTAKRRRASTDSDAGFGKPGVPECTVPQEAAPNADSADSGGGPLVYRVPHVARLLGLTEARVYELVRRSVIPACRVGRQVLIPIGAFHRWLESGMDGAADP